jgi:hypothetical protein
MDGSDYLTSLPIVLKPKPATVRLEVVPSTSIHRFNRPLQQTTSSLSVAGFGFRTIGRLVWMDGSDYLTSLPIVLKPKPATVRLEVVDRSGGLSTSIHRFNRPLQQTTSSLSVAGFGFRTIGRLVKYGQAGSGLLEWSVEAVDRSGWMDWDLTNLPIVLKP